MQPILEITGLTKRYPGRGRSEPVTALADVNLTVAKGEIFALLGPNGAGKTTLIGAVCGLVRPSAGTIRAFGIDLGADWRRARSRIGLVPQELGFDPFDEVWRAVAYSRGLFGLPRDDARLEKVLRALSLWDKRDQRIRALSGGMKRRVLIAKALAHDPQLLFLDEPTAGVDVELRRDMWRQIDALRDLGVTIILTTHYIEEAEEMADRVGVISKGRLMLVEEKHALMTKLGLTEARITLSAPLAEVPQTLTGLPVTLEDGGRVLCYRGGGARGEGDTDIARIVKRLVRADIGFTAIATRESTLEDIFVDLLENGHGGIGRNAGSAAA